MSVPCPPIRWPAFLEDAGPAEDATILLSATAQVGDTQFRVIAMRVEPRLRFMPDYKLNVDPAAYNQGMLETLLADLGDIGESDHAATVQLSTGLYVMWMIAATTDAAREQD
jgi:hypothetical protein